MKNKVFYCKRAVSIVVVIALFCSLLINNVAALENQAVENTSQDTSSIVVSKKKNNSNIKVLESQSMLGAKEKLNIPDAFFRKLIWKTVFGITDSDKEFTIDELKQINDFNGSLILPIEGYDYTGDVTGIEYFKNLTELDAGNANELKVLDLSNNAELIKVNCSGMQNLKVLILDGCPKLKELSFASTPYLDYLDVSGNTELVEIDGANSNIRELNIGNNSNLTSLKMNHTKLFGLDLKGAPQLSNVGAVLELNDIETVKTILNYYEKDSGVYYDSLDMAKLPGIKDSNAVLNLKSGYVSENIDRFYNKHTGFLDMEDGYVSGSIKYEYAIFGTENPARMQVELKYDFTPPTNNVDFYYLDATGKNWISATVRDVEVAKSATPPKIPTIEGYTFKGWSLDPGSVTSSFTSQALYAKEDKKYKVTFQDYDGNQIGEVQEVSKGKDAIAPPFPEHEGFEFYKFTKPIENVQDDITVKAIYRVIRFDDLIFRKYILSKIGRVDDPYDIPNKEQYYIYSTDLDSIRNTEFTIESYQLKGAKNLNGIEYLTGLKHLSFEGTPDVKPLLTVPLELPGLKYMQILESALIKEPPADKSNSFVTLDLSKNINLKTIQLIKFPNLQNLKFGNNNNLDIIRIYDIDKLGEVDLSGCPNIGKDAVESEVGDMVFSNCGLTKLTIGSKPYLKYLLIPNNPLLSTINISDAPSLKSLDASKLNLTGIDVSKNYNLKTLNVSFNKLKYLDLKNNTKLEELYMQGGIEGVSGADGNEIRRLSLSENRELKRLYCSSNEIEELDLNGNEKLKYLDCSNNKISELNLGQIPNILELDCSNNNLSSLNLGILPELTILGCGSNYAIKSLDFSKNSKLEIVRCPGIKLRSLDFSRNKKLKALQCSNSDLLVLNLDNTNILSQTPMPSGPERTVLDNQEECEIFTAYNKTSGKYEYNIKNLVGEGVDLQRISFDDLIGSGSYDNKTGLITLNNKDLKSIKFKYQTNNSNAPILETTFNINYEPGKIVKYYEGDTLLKTVEVAEGSKLVAPTDVPPIKVGMKFVEWYQDKELSNAWDFNNEVSDDISLYARIVRKTFDVEFVSNGGSEVTKLANVDYGKKLTKPKNPILLGQALKGWFKNNELDDEWKFEEDFITGKTILYAKWEAKKYKVSYQSGTDKTVYPDKKDVLYDDDSLLPTSIPDRKGYDFLNWKIDNRIVDNTMQYIDLVANDDVMNITLVANYKPHNFKVKYESGYADINIPTEIVEWEEAILMPIPKKPGYLFEGWYLGDNKVAKDQKYGDLVIDDTDGTGITLVAKWSELNDYTVIYDLNGGILSSDVPLIQTGLKYVDSVTLPQPTKAKNEFLGWGYKGKISNNIQNYNVYESDDTVKTITLKAQWKMKKYSVSFDSGMKIDKIMVDEDSKIDQPTVAIKQGYYLVGWYKDKEYKNQWNYDIDTVTSDITLYAKWELDTTNTNNPNNPDSNDVNDKQIANKDVATGDHTNEMLYLFLIILSGSWVLYRVHNKVR